MSAGMTELVYCRPDPISGREIRVWRRYLDVVLRRHIEGTIAADPKVDPHGSDQRLDPRLEQCWLCRVCGDCELVRHVLALCQVEYGEALQERNCLRFIASLCRLHLRALGNEAVGVDHSGAVFTFANIGTEDQCLPECQPALS